MIKYYTGNNKVLNVVVNKLSSGLDNKSCKLCKGVAIIIGLIFINNTLFKMLIVLEYACSSLA